MNTALLVLRDVPGVVLIGHGLQKLVPARFSPPLLHANGLRVTGAGFEQIGIRPGVAAALLAGSSEIIGGFSLGAGLLTPVGTILVGAVMTTAMLTAHARNGIWNQEGGFEFPLVLLTVDSSSVRSVQGRTRSTTGPASRTGPGSTGRSVPSAARRSRLPSAWAQASPRCSAAILRGPPPPGRASPPRANG